MSEAPAPTAVRPLWSRIAWSLVALYAVLVAIGLRLQGTVGLIGLADVWLYVSLLWGAVVGALIVARAPRHPIGWLFIIVGLSYAAGLVAQVYAIHALVFDPGSLPAGEVAAWISFWITMPGIAGLVLFLPLLFPDGHLPSQRWRPVGWLCGALLAVAVLVTTITPDHYTEYPNIRNPLGIEAWDGVLQVWNAVSEFLLLGLVVLCAVALSERFRRAATVERLQIRWFAFSVAVLVIAVFVDMAGRLIPGLRQASDVLALVAVTGIPTATGIAILRYRLYEIDVIINRTVVYASLTAILAGLYTAAVALFQRAFVALTGEGSDIAIVLTLFVLATVFTPVKNRLQASADKYIEPVAPSSTEGSTAIDDLVRLAELHSRGILTDAEFAAKKKQVLGI
jgi:hypothetical protein